MKRTIIIWSLAFLSLVGSTVSAGGLVPGTASPIVSLKSLSDAPEAERLIRAALRIAPERRLAFFSRCLLGRRYHPETKKRISGQRQQPVTKREATNPSPLPVTHLATSLAFLDCMTYVEHVLALTFCEKPEYTGCFLPRLIDLMFDAEGGPLFNHQRNHFTSLWAITNARKGYLVDVAAKHPLAVRRTLTLNRVADNRTFYVEDRFMIAPGPTSFAYFPLSVVTGRRAPLESGDIVALVCDKEGLDVTHMGFFMQPHEKPVLRHASLAKNRIVDEDFYAYVQAKKGLVGLMVLRPCLPPGRPVNLYRFDLLPQPAKP
ncbi:MAG TPA: DUF1460 domain-containing protein [Candidatus Ozemobacteraceae bacterium]|nr:DUF1460 domain-containing protein [Candidatus Ozemobacteraceae bacterium]